jgi:hypothetical protein
MAGQKPFFITGANAKVRVNKKTLAFCTNVSYSVEVRHATPRVLGMYEPTSVEPLSYIVTGSFSVIRYAADAKDKIKGANPNSVQSTGNGIGTWGEQSYFDKLKSGLKSPSTDNRVQENLNPKDLSKAAGFELEIFQKILHHRLLILQLFMLMRIVS